MYRSYKTYIIAESRVLDLINDNSIMLLFLQHFNIDCAVDNKTVEQVCNENGISLKAFITIGNLFNGFLPDEKEIFTIEEIKSILLFLKNTHSFYKEDIYPELLGYIQQLTNKCQNKDVILIEKFFNDYFNEVLEHLKYEDEVAFPYFFTLLEGGESNNCNFSVRDYFFHHSDIETKVTDLKNLFLKHINIKNQHNTKRKFLETLFQLEFDLKVHSIIEEKVLIPSAENIEKGRKNG